jgi:hypothetical protein
MRIRFGGGKGVKRGRAWYIKAAGTVVVILAVGGGSAWAASASHKAKPKHHYTITSVGQIAPGVLSKLHGANGTNGTNGTNGAAGATGSTGTTGPTGAAGPFPATLPSGKTLTGAYAVVFEAAAGNAFDADAYSYAFPLATAPTVNYIPMGGTPPAQCPGTVAAPAAAPGNLCVFEDDGFNLAAAGVGFRIIDTATATPGESGKMGFEIQIGAAAAGLTESLGTWAVTAS